MIRSCEVANNNADVLAIHIPDKIANLIKEIIYGIISKLDDSSRKVLLVAALLGEEFESAILTDILRADVVQTETLLQRLSLTTRIIEYVRTSVLPVGTKSARYRFAHVHYHQALYSLMSEEVDQHRQWASSAVGVLTSRYGENNPHLAFQLARLLEEEEKYSEAVKAYADAAELALASFAHCQNILSCPRQDAARRPSAGGTARGNQPRSIRMYWV